ncbi:hypothetical protein T484DRAFT_1617518 [Baffinella frigidus]|nr:hypothetical protein T484DRAFT_1617518 [Cryptophyta sp. CCMP2293]
MAPPAPRDAHLHKVLASWGKGMQEKVAASRVLVVGAGGIGCELLKVLVLSGFTNLDIVDLDTIDVSNLNRQFLFRMHHVSESKANIAAQAAKGFNPNINITPHHGNIKDKKFGVQYMSQFSVVFNALDNIEARRHVNRVCIAAGRPLVDGGTSGYDGQVTTIIKGETGCYDCEPKPAPKGFPVCTIRSTPDKPIHCIVWGKHLFALLFGTKDDANAVAEVFPRPPGTHRNQTPGATHSHPKPWT